VLAPLWIPGLIVNFLPYAVVQAAGRATRKPVMKGTNRVLAALFAFPVTWAAVVLVVRPVGWLATIALVVALPIAGMVTVSVLERIIRAFRAWRGWQGLRERRALLDDIVADRKRLVEAVERAAETVPEGAERQPAVESA
jgi:hypothetical protein